MPPGRNLRELSVHVVFESDQEAAINEAASAFARRVGSTAFVDPELHIFTPQPSVTYDQIINQHHLSERQAEAILLAKNGLSNAEIGQKMGLTEQTIKGYMSAAFAKMGINKRSQIGTKFDGAVPVFVPWQPQPPRSTEIVNLAAKSAPDSLWEAARNYWIQGNPLSDGELNTLDRLSRSLLLEYGLENQHIDAAVFMTEGLEYKQIARRMGVTPGTVSGYMKKALSLSSQDSRQSLGHHILVSSLREIISLSLGPAGLCGHTAQQQAEIVDDILRQRQHQCMKSFRLTRREQRVVRQCIVQPTLAQTATALTIAPQTLNKHTAQIFKKTAINNNRIHLLRKVYGIELCSN